MAKKVNSRPSLNGVASAERTLQVLAAFRSGDASLELAELAQRTGLVKSTIMRLAVSLERYGFLVRTVDGTYALGGEIGRLAGIYSQSQDLAQEIEPVLEYLAVETEETATFWVREGNERRCLFRVNSPLQLRLDIQPGTKRPMDKSSSATVLRHFTSTSSRPPPPLPFYSTGATTPHVASMSVPVFGQGQEFLGTLSLSGPDSRLNAARAREIGPLLIQASQDLSRRLGGRPYEDAHAASHPTAAKRSARAPGSRSEGGRRVAKPVSRAS